jgi:hypothetical protein
MESNPLEKAVRDIQDTLVVMAHIEKLQSEHLRVLLEFRNRTEQNLIEITDKLNRLIGYIDNQNRGQQ